MNALTTKYLKKKLYKDFKTNHKVYCETINSLLDENSSVLDFGCGRGLFKCIDKPVRRHCGVDVDSAIFENKNIGEAKLIENNCIPYPDSTFDLVHSRMVLEHVEDPQNTFKEIHRVLKQKGHFVFFTPNKYHYASLIAANTPQWFHELFVSNISKRSEDDVFETYYRVNDKEKIQKISRSTNFIVRKIIYREPIPGYLQFSYPTFLIGSMLEKLFNNFSAFKYLRHGIIGILQKE